MQEADDRRTRQGTGREESHWRARASRPPSRTAGVIPSTEQQLDRRHVYRLAAMTSARSFGRSIRMRGSRTRSIDAVVVI